MAHHPDFEAYSCFVRLDRSGDGLLDSFDIENFLRENHRSYLKSDIELLLSYFDIDGDGALNYTEFLQMCLPCDNLTLRSIAA